MMSPAHWLIVALVVVLFFGGSRLADLGKGLGEGIRGFKKGLTDPDDGQPKADAKQIKAGDSGSGGQADSAKESS